MHGDFVSDDGMDELDALDESLGLEAEWNSPATAPGAGAAFEEGFEEGFEDDELDAFELDAGDDLDELEADPLDDELASFGEFAMDGASGLYLPEPPRLVTGQQALAVARQLNPLALEALDADDADAFLRRIGRSVRRAASGIRRGIGRGLRTMGPLLQRALPMIQRVAGFAGPWGRVISAGLGAARGLMAGQGFRGALAGAVGGLIPGAGGRIASSLLGGEGADDDASLDALADMADAGEVDAMVALPAGAGLASRIAVRHGLGAGPRAIAGGVLPSDRRAWQRGRQAERIMLMAATAARGSTGRRLRVLRSIARLASQILQREQARRGPSAAARAVPTAVRRASRQVLARAQSNPRAAASTRPAAQQRLAARARIMRRIPANFVIRGRGHIAVAA
ncbi:MAG TPA: hypothetical protein VM686_02665 [Polyangiaceae bacterium]|nr:hypothetical protein [Polyangiaceae bacterium]